MTDRLADLGQQSERRYCLWDLVCVCVCAACVTVMFVQMLCVCLVMAVGLGLIARVSVNASLLLKVRQEEYLSNWIGPGSQCMIHLTFQHCLYASHTQIHKLQCRSTTNNKVVIVRLLFQKDASPGNQAQEGV